MHVARWGNSLAVRIPAILVAKLGLAEGDEIALRPAAEGRTTALDIERRPGRQELLQELRKHRGLVPADYKFKRSDAYDDY
jgi:antitoxin MazE